MGRNIREKINKMSEILNDTINQQDLMDIDSTDIPTHQWQKCIILSHGIFPRIGHIIGQKISLKNLIVLE